MLRDQAKTVGPATRHGGRQVTPALKGVLLVHVPTEGEAEALQLAVTLATAAGGAVDAVIAEGVEAVALGGREFTSGSLLQALLDAQRRRMAAATARTELERAAARAPVTISQEEQFPEIALASHACGSDFIVAVRLDDPGVHAVHADVSALLLKTGMPVLLAPRNAEPLCGDRVVVAWRDSREARRAVSDAMPLLVAAEEVLVVSVSPQDRVDHDQITLERVVARLKRHGCEARCELHQTDGRMSVSEVLQNRAHSISADLIVAGAYAHSRAGEWIFGGVTRSLIESCSTYLLMSH